MHYREKKMGSNFCDIIDKIFYRTFDKLWGHLNGVHVCAVHSPRKAL